MKYRGLPSNLCFAKSAIQAGPLAMKIDGSQCNGATQSRLMKRGSIRLFRTDLNRHFGRVALT
jgi:hypothetical protein